MKQWIIAVAVGALLSTVAPAGFAEEGDAAKPETQMQKVSYAIGQQLGGSFKQQGIEIDMDNLVKGVLDAMTGAEPMMTPEEMQSTMQAFQQEMMAKQKKLAEEAGAKNKEEGAAFLAKNATAEGVKTTESGLQYKVLTAGDGPTPTDGDTVSVHYTGTLLDGTKFDSSHDRGQPATFPVTGVIPGWTEALQLMPVGSKWKLFIPSDLAYGPRGAGGQIGPDATLVFEVELLGIEAKE